MRPVLLVTMLLALAQGVVAAPRFPPLTGRVVDRAGMISPAVARSLTALLAAHEKATTNQVVVATVENLQGYSIEEFGYQLGRYWGIGQKGKNNGVLLLIARKERRVRIEVGYGLEGVITDAIASTIVNRVITPRFRAGQMDAGIQEGARAIVAALQGDYEPPPGGAPDEVSGFVPLAHTVFILFIMLLVVSQLFGRTRVGRLLGLWWISSYLVRGSGRSGRGGFRGGGFGGFSGGGGSFGGGGASGGW